MYRSSSDSLAQTVDRLERELAELTVLRGWTHRRQRALAAITAVSVLTTVVCIIALCALRDRAAEIEKRYDAVSYWYGCSGHTNQGSARPPSP